MSSEDYVSIHRLHAHPANIRRDLGDLTELAASVREHGILQALIVEPDQRRRGHYLVLGGHRRLEAARLAGLDELPVSIRKPSGSAGTTVVMLVENCQRSDLGPVEKAEAMGRLRDREHMSAVAISRATGLSQSAVSYYLSLLDLDEASRERVRAGQVGAGEAIAAVRKVRAQSRGKPRRKAVVQAPYFGADHPLAGLARETCKSAGHKTGRLGRTACGACFEAAIRADALAPMAAAS